MNPFRSIRPFEYSSLVPQGWTWLSNLKVETFPLQDVLGISYDFNYLKIVDT